MIIFDKLKKVYSTFAILLLNTIFCILILNGLCSLGFKISKIFSKDPVMDRYDPSIVYDSYPDMNKSNVDQMLHESTSRTYIFEPFVQFRERPYKGKYFNVHEAGFRVGKNQGPWPPVNENHNIFIFGGSTTFGYGLPDDQTIGSHLQEILRKTDSSVAVYNFACGSYYSTQEKILFQELLAEGLRPDKAIFIDGLNDFYYYNNEPHFTPQLRDLVAGKDKSNQLLNKYPLTRVAVALVGNDPIVDEKPVIPVVDDILHRYLQNKMQIESISSKLDIETLFVWQPVPTFGYEQSLHPFAVGGYGGHELTSEGYPVMDTMRKTRDLGENFLWAANLHDGLDRPLYVDKIHYNSEFSQLLAKAVSKSFENQ
jgi:hypothetical protein